MDSDGCHTVTGIFIYPLKSAAGIELTEADVDDFGFRFDRRWMLVDEASRFLTQRTHPRLALLGTRIEDDALRVSAPGADDLLLPLEPAETGGHGAQRVVVWDDTVDAIPASDEAAAWTSEFLGSSCRPVYMPRTSFRPVSAKYEEPGIRTAFTDGSTFLLISEESLAELNGRLSSPLPMNRFRPNIVTQGGRPHAEDWWRSVRIRDVTFRVALPCARCSIPSVDQATGARGKEPLRTLATYRRHDGLVWFGQNLLHFGVGRIGTGDRVEILETADDPNPRLDG